MSTVDFLQALFQPGDTILFRPIETWTEGDKRNSRVDYAGINYHTVGLGVGRNGRTHYAPFPARTAAAVDRMTERAAVEKTNCFFGVCPRHAAGSDSSSFDLAWQIRTVRALWSDIDDVPDVETALARCTAASLPAPSIVVSSGHGVHLYWLLETPITIDTTPPAPVHTEFVDQGDGKKKRRRLWIAGENPGERLYLDVPTHRPALSTKAQAVQDTLAGIAAAIGGDHTTDLSRILRVPGTLNRKNERNGKTPVPCELVSCDPGRRYPFSLFAQFEQSSPQRRDRERIAKIPLPRPRTNKPGVKDQRRLDALIADCVAADAGTRSEADFALCCWAVEDGLLPDFVWQAVASAGKFAEAGRRYFDLTWAAACGHTREKIYTAARAKITQKAEEAASRVGDKTVSFFGEEGPGAIPALAEEICAKHHFAKDAGGRLHVFEAGRYVPGGEKVIKAAVKGLLRRSDESNLWRTKLTQEIVEYIQVDAPTLWDRPRLEFLNLRNGLLRVSDRKLFPHDPAHLCVVQLPVTYDPQAASPAIDKFVGEVFPADARHVAWELIAWLMRPDLSIQKAVLLTGEGANGKSTWLTLVQSFLGNENVAAVPLHKLEADRFSPARIVGRLANICADLPSTHLESTSVFKAIVGNDSILVERKYSDAFEWIPWCRLVFSANHPPRSSDGSFAFFRRWYVVPFDMIIPESARVDRTTLDAALSDPGELSGLLNHALDALPRLAAQRGFSEPASCKAAWSEFHAQTDPLGVWMSHYTIEDHEAIVPCETLRAAYNAAADREGRPGLSGKAFGGAIRRVHPNLRRLQRVVGGKLTWCYLGIGMLSETSQASLFDARHSLHSPDSPDRSLLLSEKTEAEEERLSRELTIGDNPVNPVNVVNEEPAGCRHVWVDTQQADGVVRRNCSVCGKFFGYVRSK